MIQVANIQKTSWWYQTQKLSNIKQHLTHHGKNIKTVKWLTVKDKTAYNYMCLSVPYIYIKLQNDSVSNWLKVENTKLHLTQAEKYQTESISNSVKY